MAARNQPTLKGVFPQPKLPPKRDFLKENKLRLKSIQKQTIRKTVSNESELSTRRQQQQQQQRTSRKRFLSAAPTRMNSGCSTCISKKTQNTVASSTDIPRSIHCDKSIQTDEICDEEFLSDALKRCFTNGMGDIDRHRNISTGISDNCPTEDRVDTNRYNSSENFELIEQNENEAPDFHETHTNSELNHGCDSEAQFSTEQEKCKRQTRYTGPLDAKDRVNVKLPRYLEREKREKELQRLKEMERDPRCPKGHYVLDEKDRKDALIAAEKRFDLLVSELNRMPMSSQTLRIRNRKMEIEKALIELEKNIKTFSKNKVYVKDGH